MICDSDDDRFQCVDLEILAVTHIVGPALWWAFLAARNGADRFLVVAHSNAQAHGISTDAFRAQTAHSGYT